MPKPISLEDEYPTTEKLSQSKKEAYQLLPLYAGYHGELSGVLQYICYYLRFCELGDLDTANVILGIAISEVEHLKLLGKTLRKLGCEERFICLLPNGEGAQNKRLRYSKTPRAMLLDSIAGELSSISEYGKIKKKLKDSPLKDIIERIISDEIVHARALEDRLKDWYKRGK